MKIAIYGDSYANGGTYNAHTWATKLAGRLGADSIDYYAESGTPFFHCYSRVLNTAHSYDRIIVAVTEPYRFPVRVEGRYVYNVGAVDHLSPQNRRNMFQWYSQVDPSYLLTVQALMIDRIRDLYPEAVFVPCFPASMNLGFDLMAVRSLALTTLGLDPEGGYRELTGWGQTLCHIPWTWHDQLADLLYEYVVAGVVPRFDTAAWPKLEGDYYLRR